MISSSEYLNHVRLNYLTFIFVNADLVNKCKCVTGVGYRSSLLIDC